MTVQFLTVLLYSSGQQASGDDWSRVEPGKEAGRKEPLVNFSTELTKNSNILETKPLDVFL